MLYSRNEIELKPLRASGILELVLVDHHALPAEDAELASAVLEVIDHRPQDTNWPWIGCRLALDTVGSCASLVARNIFQRRPDIANTLASLLKGEYIHYHIIYRYILPCIPAVYTRHLISLHLRRGIETALSFEFPATRAIKSYIYILHVGVLQSAPGPFVFDGARADVAKESWGG